MNESITRAAGAKHGEEWSPASIESTISNLDRVPLQRTTLYGTASLERNNAAMRARPLANVINTPPCRGRYESSRAPLVSRLQNAG